MIEAALQSLLVLTLVGAHRFCGEPPMMDVIIHNVDARGVYRNGVRITPVFTNAFPSESEFYVQSEILQPAINYWKNAMTAKYAISHMLHLARSCVGNSQAWTEESQQLSTAYCTDGCDEVTRCGLTPVPEAYLDACYVLNNSVVISVKPAGHGARNSDYVLLVDSLNYSCIPFTTFAWAGFCQMDSVNNRPILGVINFCPGFLNMGLSKQRLINYAIHELGHALGLSSSAYAFLHDNKSQPLTARGSTSPYPISVTEGGVYAPNESVLSTEKRLWQSAATSTMQDVPVLKTPKLLEFAKKHYDCSSLTGVELETKGGEGLALSHFEQRWTAFEIMSATGEENMRTSGMTLAYFDDTNWYTVNYRAVEKWSWGKGLGCDFLLKSCYSYMKMQYERHGSIQPWCDTVEPESAKCVSYAEGRRCCDIYKRPSQLPQSTQYFEELQNIPQTEVKYYAGADELAEYCPYGKYTELNEHDEAGQVTGEEKKKEKKRVYWLLVALLIPLSVSLAIFLMVYIPVKISAMKARQIWCSPNYNSPI